MRTTLNFNPYTSANISKIPNNAMTHYSYCIYPATIAAPKTMSAAVRPHSANTRKIIAQKTDTPIEAKTISTSQPAAPQKQISTSHTHHPHVDKQALAEYFDNSNRTSASEQWLADVIEGLNRQDTQRQTDANKEQEKLREFVESKRQPVPQFANLTNMDKHYIVLVIVDLTAIMSRIFQTILEQMSHQNQISATDEINANILDKFERRMQHESQAHGMKKMHIHQLRQKQK